MLFSNRVECILFSSSNKISQLSCIYSWKHKCPYLMTFDLELEHNLDGDTPGDHCVLSGTERSSISKQTGRQKNRQTDRHGTSRHRNSSFHLVMSETLFFLSIWCYFMHSSQTPSDQLIMNMIHKTCGSVSVGHDPVKLFLQCLRHQQLSLVIKHVKPIIHAAALDDHMLHSQAHIGSMGLYHTDHTSTPILHWIGKKRNENA